MSSNLSDPNKVNGNERGTAASDRRKARILALVEYAKKHQICELKFLSAIARTKFFVQQKYSDEYAREALEIINNGYMKNDGVGEEGTS